jgi:hypothetical protein
MYQHGQLDAFEVSGSSPPCSRCGQPSKHIHINGYQFPEERQMVVEAVCDDCCIGGYDFPISEWYDPVEAWGWAEHIGSKFWGPEALRLINELLPPLVSHTGIKRNA